MKTKTNEKRENGFTVYPDSALLKEIDRLAVEANNKRSPMAVLLMRKGIEAMRKRAAK